MAAPRLREEAMVAMTKSRPLAAALGTDQGYLLTTYEVPLSGRLQRAVLC